MIISPYRTSVTAAHQDGTSLSKITPDMTRRAGPGSKNRRKIKITKENTND